MSINSNLIVLVLILTFGSVACAAYTLQYQDPIMAPIVAAPVFSWTGGYIGINPGYAGGKFN